MLSLYEYVCACMGVWVSVEWSMMLKACALETVKTLILDSILLYETKSNVFTMNSIFPNSIFPNFPNQFELQLLPSFSCEILSSSAVEATTLISGLDALGYIASRMISFSTV